MGDDKEFQERTAEIEALVQKVHALEDGNARSVAVELLQAMMDLHGSVLERMLELTAEGGDAGQQMLDKFAADPLVSGMLVLYDLHPDPLETRITRALEKTLSQIASHGADVQLLAVDGAVVRVKLETTSNGSSLAKLTSAVEQAIYEAAPEIQAVEINGATKFVQQTQTFVPLGALQTGTAG